MRKAVVVRPTGSSKSYHPPVRRWIMRERRCFIGNPVCGSIGSLTRIRRRSWYMILRIMQRQRDILFQSALRLEFMKTFICIFRRWILSDCIPILKKFTNPVKTIYDPAGICNTVNMNERGIIHPNCQSKRKLSYLDNACIPVYTPLFAPLSHTWVSYR